MNGERIVWRCLVVGALASLLVWMGVACTPALSPSSDMAGDMPESCDLPVSADAPAAPATFFSPGFGVHQAAMACGPGSKQTPDPMTFPGSPEAYTKYVGQSTCNNSPKPGVVAFRDLLLKTYPCTGDYGISRACSAGGTSEHKEGRAWDWKLNAPHPAADAVIDWLLKTRDGVPHAIARRVGLMYMIWNRKIWKAYQASKGWQNYTGASPHTDHVHFSFSWDGANKKTSFFAATTTTPPKLNAKKLSQSAQDALPGTAGADYTLCPGQSFSVSFKVENTGDVAWSDVNKNEAGKAVRLGHQSGKLFGAPNRISINNASAKTAAKGASVTFTIPMKAPTQAGSYKTEWQMVSELVAWFGPKMSMTFAVNNVPPTAGQSCQVQGGSGSCGQGTLKCTPQGLVCVGASGSVELCNNKDDDCDGKVDNGLTRPCYTGPAGTQDVGRCRSGSQACQAGQWAACAGSVVPDAQETCGNTVDDNCNGQIDEGCSASGGCEDKDGDGYGSGPGCPGEQDCNDNDKSINPGAPEICGNNIDDDCRGGDRPCQNSLPEQTSELEQPNTTPDAGAPACANPPCGNTTPIPNEPPRLPPSQTLIPSGRGCSVATEPNGSWGGLLCLFVAMLLFGPIRRQTR